MTRAIFRKLLIQAGVLLLVTFFFLLVMNMATNRRLESEKQDGLQKTLGIVLPAERYRQITLTSYQEKYPSIQSAFAAYDKTDTVIGYIFDVTNETETGKITARMSFSPDGQTLIALRVLDSDENNAAEDAVSSQEFYSQFEGIRVPAALLADLPEKDSSIVEYPPISGLTDGTFREQQQKEDEAGYKDFVEIVVKGGRITAVTWDAVQTDGGNNRAKASVDGEFVLADNSVIWAAQAYEMQNKLIEVQDPAKIAIKSDGTTEVVPDVSVSVNAFVSLANKCIEDSKSGLVSASVTPAETAPGALNSDAAAPTLQPSSQPSSQPSETPGNAASDPSAETSGVYLGSEDGVVKNSDGGILPDTIDGLPSSFIKSKIKEASGYRQSSRTVVSCVNQAYVFLTEYLKGGA